MLMESLERGLDLRVHFSARKRFERSDGLQNLTESLFAARVLPPGVWIVMHGQVFDVDHARKDRDLARFVVN